MLLSLVDKNIILKMLNILFSSLLFLIMPTLEFFFASYYQNKIKCNNSLMNLSVWLVIKGITSYLSIICLLLSIMSDRQTLFYTVFSPFSIILILFTIVWLIIGSVIFFKDCLNVEETELNTFMYISLISGYITTCLMLSMENETVDRKKTPILYV
jgi:hypothetical protein